MKRVHEPLEEESRVLHIASQVAEDILSLNEAVSYIEHSATSDIEYSLILFLTDK